MAGHGAVVFTKTPVPVPYPYPTQAFKFAEKHSEAKEIEFTVTVHIEDVPTFINESKLEATLTGTVTIGFFSPDPLPLSKGWFNLFVKPSSSTDLDTAKEMQYTLYFSHQGKPYTLYGFKEILKEQETQIWKQTTTLYFYLWEGHSRFSADQQPAITHLGVLHISAADFLKQLTTFESQAPTPEEQHKAFLLFVEFFAGKVWESYAPAFFSTTSKRWNEHYFPIHTTQGVALGKKELYHIDTKDGLTLLLQRFCLKPTNKVILLSHGLTQSTDMYIMPEHGNLVNYLHQNGYTDVWSLDWRGSGRLPYNLMPHRYSLDDVARNDYPAALEFIKKTCGENININIIAHCVGSLALWCGLASGAITNIRSVISGSVSLTPHVHWQALVKLCVGPEAFEYIFGYPYISPRMAYFPGPAFGRWIYWIIQFFHRECREPACQFLSFMWGWGFPGPFNHKNMSPLTHRRLVDLFGGTSFHFYRHIRKMLFTGQSVQFAKDRFGKTVRYLDMAVKRQLPPTLFVSGADNNVFPKSHKKTFHALTAAHSSEAHGHEIWDVPDYGHQDIFMGKNCQREIFPRYVEFLNKHNNTPVKPT
jgi:triacylglycerol lipase/cholesterol oxidase